MSVYDPTESDYELHCADARKEQEAFDADAQEELERDDWAPLCRCEMCSPGNITCVSRD